jgi:hypothetical protein
MLRALLCGLIAASVTYFAGIAAAVPHLPY